MQVEFIHSGERRYGVRIKRANLPNLIMDPAPGFDNDLPHDMVHMVVEAELGLQGGVFGQLAAGGTAGSFRLEAGSGKVDAREQARERKRVARKGQAILQQARDGDISELAAAVFDTLWRSRISNRQVPPPEVAAEMTRLRRSLSAEQASAFDAAERGILAQFDRLSTQWRETNVGQSLTIDWPVLSTHT